MLAVDGALVERVDTAAGWLLDAVTGLLNIRTLVIVGIVLSGVALIWSLLRAAATRRALRADRRVRLVLLPTETFDPRPEEVSRFSAQLSRARRTVLGSLDRPAQAVRIRLDSIANGQCVYRVEGSRRAESVLRLSGYAEVDVRPVEALEGAALAARAAPVTEDDPADDTRRDGRQPEPDEEPPCAR